MHGFDTDNQCLRQHPHLCPDQHPLSPIHGLRWEHLRLEEGGWCRLQYRDGVCKREMRGQPGWNLQDLLCERLLHLPGLQERWVCVHEEERRGG